MGILALKNDAALKTELESSTVQIDRRLLHERDIHHSHEEEKKETALAQGVAQGCTLQSND